MHDDEAVENFFKIEQAMTVSEATCLRDALILHFDTSGGFYLDMSNVDECDAAGVQLLIAARKTADDAARPFVVKQISKAVSHAMAVAGIAADKMFNLTKEQ